VLDASSLVTGCFRGFSEKKRLNARSFAREFLRSGCSTDPVKVSKDAASLLACTRKKILLGECGFFVSDVKSGGLLGHFGPLRLALWAPTVRW